MHGMPPVPVGIETVTMHGSSFPSSSLSPVALYPYIIPPPDIGAVTAALPPSSLLPPSFIPPPSFSPHHHPHPALTCIQLLRCVREQRLCLGCLDVRVVEQLPTTCPHFNSEAPGEEGRWGGGGGGQQGAWASRWGRQGGWGQPIHERTACIKSSAVAALAASVVQSVKPVTAELTSGGGGLEEGTLHAGVALRQPPFL